VTWCNVTIWEKEVIKSIIKKKGLHSGRQFPGIGKKKVPFFCFLQLKFFLGDTSSQAEKGISAFFHS